MNRLAFKLLLVYGFLVTFILCKDVSSMDGKTDKICGDLNATLCESENVTVVVATTTQEPLEKNNTLTETSVTKMSTTERVKTPEEQKVSEIVKNPVHVDLKKLPNHVIEKIAEGGVTQSSTLTPIPTTSSSTTTTTTTTSTPPPTTLISNFSLSSEERKLDEPVTEVTNGTTVEQTTQIYEATTTANKLMLIYPSVENGTRKEKTLKSDLFIVYAEKPRDDEYMSPDQRNKREEDRLLPKQSTTEGVVRRRKRPFRTGFTSTTISDIKDATTSLPETDESSTASSTTRRSYHDFRSKTRKTTSKPTSRTYPTTAKPTVISSTTEGIQKEKVKIPFKPNNLYKQTPGRRTALFPKPVHRFVVTTPVPETQKQVEAVENTTAEAEKNPEKPKAKVATTFADRSKTEMPPKAPITEAIRRGQPPRRNTDDNRRIVHNRVSSADESSQNRFKYLPRPGQGSKSGALDQTAAASFYWNSRYVPNYGSNFFSRIRPLTNSQS